MLYYRIQYYTSQYTIQFYAVLYQTLFYTIIYFTTLNYTKRSIHHSMAYHPTHSWASTPHCAILHYTKLQFPLQSPPAPPPQLPMQYHSETLYDALHHGRRRTNACLPGANCLRRQSPGAINAVLPTPCYGSFIASQPSVEKC